MTIVTHENSLSLTGFEKVVRAGVKKKRKDILCQRKYSYTYYNNNVNSKKGFLGLTRRDLKVGLSELNGLTWCTRCLLRSSYPVSH